MLLLSSMLGALGSQQNTMAYHILHTNKNMLFLRKIMAEVLQYPVTTHVYIHTHSSFQMPKQSVLPNITIVKHEVDMGASKLLHSMERVSRLEARGDMLAMTPSVREHIINVGRVHAFSMYSEDDLLVRAETVQLWMVSHEDLLARNVSLGFIRVECKTVCNSVDILLAPAHEFSLPTNRRFTSLFETDSRYCGTWLYSARELARLDRQYPSFLRYNREAGKWNMRESLGIGGAEAYHRVAVPFDVDRRGPASSSVVLQYGAKKWQYGVWWCKLFLFGGRCSLPPESFYRLATLKTPKAERARATESLVLPAPVSANASQVMNALRPLALSTCSLSSVSVNNSRLYQMSSPAMFVPPHPLHVAYGPWLTKCGSSSATKLIHQVTNTSHIGTCGKLVMSPYMYHNYTFISFVRHPLDRALAGYHQMEVFYQFGWLKAVIPRFGLTWWDSHCLNSTFGVASFKRGHTCSGSVPNNSRDTVLRRLVGYLEEVDRIGFFDQHLTPMSWLLATHPVATSPRAFVFDMKAMHNVSKVLSTFTGHTWYGIREKKRDTTKDNLPWAISWKELVIESATSPMALRAVELLCRLYRDDIMCLPYDVPECEGLGL